MVVDGPFGPQISGGTNLGEDPGDFYLPEDVLYYDGEDSGTLLKHADAAMYRAKEMGGNTFQFYSAEMGSHAMKRLTLENDLRMALDRAAPGWNDALGAALAFGVANVILWGVALWAWERANAVML